MKNSPAKLLQLSIILLAIPFLIGACGQGKPKLAECNPDNIVYFPKDAFARFYFTDADHWIYRDSVSHKEDSVWVDRSRQNIFHVFKDQPLYRKCYECYYYELFSQAGSRTRVWMMPNGVNDDRSYTEEDFRVDFDLDTGEYIRNERFMLDGDAYRKGSPNGGKVTFVDSLKVGTAVYSNVLHLRNPRSNRDIYKEAWYVKNIGLVKYVMKNGTVWELVRYKLNR